MMETGFKMPHEIVLSIGESFAELLAYSADPTAPAYRNRWYLPRKSLSDGLKEALKSLSLEETTEPSMRLTVATSAVERILSQNQGRSPAVLVNTGFENSIHLVNQFTTPPFSFRAERHSLPAEQDFIFGVSGKIAADGSETAPLRVEDLEQIAAKLELLKTTDVAIVFHHSHRNPQHEIQASEFLRARGFRTVMSHEMAEENKLQLTIEAAFAESAVIEEKDEIEGALKSVVKEWRVFGRNGLHAWSDYSAAIVRDGMKKAFRQFTSDETPLILHCGLDEFAVYSREDTTIATSRRIRPTQLVVHGAWPYPFFGDSSCDYAPGPMLFGKSQMLAAIDTLFVCNHLKEIQGFTPLVSEKSRSRILEALFTLAKTSDTSAKSPPEPINVAKSLARAFVEQVAVQLQLSGLANAGAKVQLIGPLAETMQPLLAERRPDLEFRCESYANWGETAAIAKAGLMGNSHSLTEKS